MRRRLLSRAEIAIQTFLLSGAAGALGTAATQVLLGRGHRIVATDIDTAAIEDNAERLCWDKERLVIRALDVRSAEAWEAVVTEVATTWGLDISINFAGHFRGAPFWTQPAAEAAQHLETNALGIFLGTAAAARVMTAVRRGHIMNVASMAALMPTPGFAYYAGSKYAVRGFSLSAAAELAPHGVAVTVVCPATIDTPMYTGHKAYYTEVQGKLASTPQTLDTVVKAMLAPRVFERRPVELHIPPLKGVVARGADLFPGAVSHLLANLRGTGGPDGEAR